MKTGAQRGMEAAGELRQRAEAAFRELQAALPAVALTDEASPEAVELAATVLHELQVHQIELELQNEELRRAQIEADGLRARYFDLFELAPVGYCTISETGVILEINRTAAGLLGEGRAGLVGRNVRRFIAPEDADRFHFFLRRLLVSDKPAAIDLCMVRSGHGRFWAHLSGSVAGTGKEPQLTISDISELKAAELAAEKAAEQRRLALEAGQLGTWEYHPDSARVVMDEVCRGIFGLPSGAPLDFAKALACIHAEDREGVAEAIRRAVGQVPGKSHHREFRVIWPDATVHWVGQFGRVYVEEGAEGGKLVCVRGVSMDVTERKRADESLGQSQRLESIGLLAAGIAHDFNNLLVPIVGGASLVLGRLPRESPFAPTLQRIVDAGEKAANLTRQMLAYAGKGIRLSQAVSLPRMVRECVDLVRATVLRNITFHLEEVVEVSAVQSDPGLIQQIVMNLILNAVDAMEGIPGTIWIRTGEVIVAEAAVGHGPLLAPARSRSLAFVEVKDTGCGMDATTRAKIFEPFFTTKFQGRGLGLAAVAGIVRTHGGSIQVTTAPGAGSTFRVLLPAMSLPEAERPPELRPEDLSGHASILVVDDEEMVTQLARDVLTLYGYEVLTAATGQAAVEAIRTLGEKIQLVLLDLTMPGLSGEETLRQLLALRPDLRVIVTSGYSEQEVRRLIGDGGIAGYLQKPYSVEQLGRIVKQSLA